MIKIVYSILILIMMSMENKIIISSYTDATINQIQYYDFLINFWKTISDSISRLLCIMWKQRQLAEISAHNCFNNMSKAG